MIEPLGERTPGGAEQMALELARWQQGRGLDVRVIAATGSSVPDLPLIDVGVTPGDITPIDTATINTPDPAALARTLERERRAFGRVKDFLAAEIAGADEPVVVHTHAFDTTPLLDFNDLPALFLHTLHCPPIAPWMTERFRRERPQDLPHVRYVTVSAACAGLWARAAGITPTVVFNGLDMESIAFGEAPGDHVLWVGRISPEKGLHTAIDLCEKAGVPLVAIGRVYDSAYHVAEIQPRLARGHVCYLGFLSRPDVFGWMRRARAVLSPITWDEPFGLVFIEALASGTPVLTVRRGAAPEIVCDGVTGFLADTPEELSRFLPRIGELDRRQCRRDAEERFSLRAAGEGYLALARELLAWR
jgi:glycosyltransferase involved in cell wall biosynthesis